MMLLVLKQPDCVEYPGETQFVAKAVREIANLFNCTRRGAAGPAAPAAAPSPVGPVVAVVVVVAVIVVVASVASAASATSAVEQSLHILAEGIELQVGAR
jgi:hypothetical protein